jgi:murein hydrolase activator
MLKSILCMSLALFLSVFAIGQQKKSTTVQKKGSVSRISSSNSRSTKSAKYSKAKSNRRIASKPIARRLIKIDINSFEGQKGRLPWPVDNGVILTNFGKYEVPGVKGIQGNNPGLTIISDEGTEVKGIYEGEVVSVFDIEGDYGVIINHGKYLTIYSNLATVNITKGQRVNAGDLLGTAKTNADGNGQIDFLIFNEKFDHLNPAPWIKKQ